MSAKDKTQHTQREQHQHRHPPGLAPTSIVVCLLLLLAGCGVTTGATGSANSPIATPAGTGTVTISGTPAGATGTASGCPLPTQVVSWPSPPTVMVTLADAAKGVTLQVGQTLEIALPFGHRWSLGLTFGAPALHLETPAGYGDSSLKSCVWRFTARQAGQITLAFTSAPICQAHMECPQLIALLRIPVTVG